MTSHEDIYPITFMKTHSAELIKEVKARRRPIFITQNGEPQVVVQDLRDFQKQRKLMMMLRVVALGEHEIKQGSLLTQDEVFSRLDSGLEQLHQEDE